MQCNKSLRNFESRRLDSGIPFRDYVREDLQQSGGMAKQEKSGSKAKSATRNAAAHQSRKTLQRVEQTNRTSANPDVSLTLKHFHRRTEAAVAFKDGKRLYLRVGDEVNHLRYDEWGIGVVMEVMTSSVPGGTCLARVRFQDGQLRCFNNDLDNEACCYYFGLRRYWNPTHGVDAIRSKMFGG